MLPDLSQGQAVRRRVHLLLSLFRPDAYHPSDHDPVGEVVPSDEHASYYTLAQGLEGQALRAALHSIIRGHVRHSYSEVWKILEEAGEDPANPNNVIGFYTGRLIPNVDRDRAATHRTPGTASIRGLSHS
jgi:hypothetical protein